MAVKMTMDTKTVVKEETKEERDKRLGSDEKKARELLAKNVKFLMDQKGWNQQELADKIGCGAARITGIMKEEWSPSIFPILHELKRLFGYSIDELLFTDIGRKWLQIHMNEKLPIIATMNFAHLFQGYYFDTSASRGRDYFDSQDALKSCIICVRKKCKSDDKLEAIGIFNLKKERADKIFEAYHKNSAWDRIERLGGDPVYYGVVEMSDKHIFIDMDYDNTKDRVHMVFHMPNTDAKDYTGGLGCMLSVSTGTYPAPCLQHILLSNKSLNVSSEDIASHVLMHYPQIRTYDEVDEVADLAAKLYGDTDGMKLINLNDRQKKNLIANEMDQVIDGMIQKNLFRTAVVEVTEDNEIREYLKTG